MNISGLRILYIIVIVHEHITVLHDYCNKNTQPIRCDNAGENGSTRLASIRCAGGLAFDIIRQTCDWRSNVKNCEQNESKLVLFG